MSRLAEALLDLIDARTSQRSIPRSHTGQLADAELRTELAVSEFEDALAEYVAAAANEALASSRLSP